MSGRGSAFRPGGKALPGDARRHNRGLVLAQLLRQGPQARADLARVTGLTGATVGGLVAELLDEGLVAEGGRRPNGIGKPATLLDIVPDARHVVCLDLSDPNRFVGGITNLAGSIIARRHVGRQGKVGTAAGGLVTDLATELLADTDRPVLGVGVSAPGVVFPGGVVQEAFNLRWHHTPLGAELRDVLRGTRVHVVNDANASVVGELRFGEHRGPNLLLVKVGLGVGAGLVVGGSLVEGDDSAAGEIGHVVVDEEGDDCACGNRGCLETVLASPRLRARLASLDKLGRRRERAAVGEHLGRTLAPVIAVLNLNAVVVSAPAGLLDETFRTAVVAAISRRTIGLVGGRVDVDFASTGADSALLGTAAVVLHEELGVP